ncbi:MAG: molybdopterin biosynthesis protein [Deltaproteobacteria bacterium]|nr:MAG: molybdopterin biosynthesis protein [Deltaproteobacteria bacterium]
MKRQVYLAMKTIEEAREIFFSRFGPESRTEPETVATENALGRVTSEPVFAVRSTPGYHSAAMDGVAVRAEETYGTTERKPKVLHIGDEAVWINTGQPLPSAYNAVIMVEKLHVLDKEHFEIRSSAYPWQNVRKVGEDIIATQLLFPQNHRIRPYDVGALISAGVFSLRVWRRPKVAIIPTGSELVSFQDEPGRSSLKQGQIIDSNSLILAGLVEENEGIPVCYPIVPDDEGEISQALDKAIKSDAHMIMINAGSSAGSRDYTVHVIGRKGEVLVHGVAMMPGKPTILAEVEGKPVIGNPGYPVSSTLSFNQFARPLLLNFQGLGQPHRETVIVRPSRDIPSKLGLEEFLRVNIGMVGSNYVATPLPRAAGSVTTLTRAEGIIRISSLSEGVSQNEELEAELLVPREDIMNTVLVIGSHDMTIDLLADEIRRGGDAIRVSSGNVGSLGGLMALKKGICHLAGSHLLDTKTGEYNISYVKRYLKGRNVTIYHLVLRDQGLIVQKGNPKNIQGLEDLPGSDILFVNRQSGSGTRVLLDYKLEQLGIEGSSIRGYDHEEFTHMAVAVDVLSGAADCGMGIFAAARALDLDFIPVEREQYDLIVPSEMVNLPGIAKVLETVRTRHFRERVAELGGYDPSASGELWKEVG